MIWELRFSVSSFVVFYQHLVIFRGKVSNRRPIIKCQLVIENPNYQTNLHVHQLLAIRTNKYLVNKSQTFTCLNYCIKIRKSIISKIFQHKHFTFVKFMVFNPVMKKILSFTETNIAQTDEVKLVRCCVTENAPRPGFVVNCYGKITFCSDCVNNEKITGHC